MKTFDDINYMIVWCTGERQSQLPCSEWKQHRARWEGERWESCEHQGIHVAQVAITTEVGWASVRGIMMRPSQWQSAFMWSKSNGEKGDG